MCVCVCVCVLLGGGGGGGERKKREIEGTSCLKDVILFFFLILTVESVQVLPL